MPETINWSFTVQIPGGPQLARTGAVPVDAYDKVVKTIPAGSTVEVLIQPDPDTGDVLLVVVSAEPCGDWLTYKVNSGTTAVPLDAPHVLLGPGAVSLLAATPPPTKLTIKNSDSQQRDSEVQILVGRKAS
jgi:hypothetical protein